MLFITNRFPKQSIRTRIGRNFDFDLNNNAPSNSVYFCERHTNNSINEIGSTNFLNRIADSDYRQIILYIHGFSNLPDDIFEAIEEFQNLCDQRKKKEALVIPLIWPCDNDFGIVKDYWDDQKSADASKYSFSRVLNKFLDWRNSEASNQLQAPCLKRINILAHSMGNRVLRETLSAWNKYDLPNGLPLLFRNTFLVAADVVNETLEEGNKGALICHASRNVAVYYASDDLALRASKAANLKSRIASRRLGHTGPERPERTPLNVYSIDCDEINTLYDPQKGHTYFRSGEVPGRPGIVFEHIFASIITGRIFPMEENKRKLVLRPL